MFAPVRVEPFMAVARAFHFIFGMFLFALFRAVNSFLFAFRLFLGHFHHDALRVLARVGKALEDHWHEALFDVNV